MSERICQREWCSYPVVGRATKLYCSTACTKGRELKTQGEQLTCDRPGCNNLFFKKMPQHRFCSQACNSLFQRKVYIERRRDKNKVIREHLLKTQPEVKVRIGSKRGKNRTRYSLYRERLLAKGIDPTTTNQAKLILAEYNIKVSTAERRNNIIANSKLEILEAVIAHKNGVFTCEELRGELKSLANKFLLSLKTVEDCAKDLKDINPVEYTYKYALKEENERDENNVFDMYIDLPGSLFFGGRMGGMVAPAGI